jgi:hypothetical protein
VWITSTTKADRAVKTTIPETSDFTMS